MEEARKRLRVCLLCIVAVAVIVGCVYYFGKAQEHRDVSEGTLVKVQMESGDTAWQEAMR